MTMQTFRLPDVGEGLTEAEILDWRVAVGDTVTVNQIIVEIETAKAAVELPSPFAGTVTALLVESGATVEVGAPIISIDDGTRRVAGGPARDGPPAPGVHRAGTKIGEVTADGKIATLVGYVAASGPAARTAAADRLRRRRFRRRRAGRLLDGRRTRRSAAPAPVRCASSAKDLGSRTSADSTGSGEDGVITRDDVQTGRTGAPGRSRGRGIPPLSRTTGRRTSPTASGGCRSRASARRPRGHGGQRLHRAARLGLPHRRRDRDDAPAPPAASPVGVQRGQDHPADVRCPGGVQGDRADARRQRVVGRRGPGDRLQELRQPRHRGRHPARPRGPQR